MHKFVLHRHNNIKFTRVDYWVLVSISILLLILSLPDHDGSYNLLGSLQYASTILKGRIHVADIAQDFYGFRALITNNDPYAILGPALITTGINWIVPISSSHPPTAFLFTAPLAFLPWPIASALWAWFMLIGLAFSFRFFGFSWKTSFCLTVAALFWPPTIYSLGNITIIWLLGLMIAFQFRDRSYFWSGFFVGISSFTKFFPALLLIPFIIRKKWRALVGFISAWVTGLTIITILDPNAILRYITVNSNNSIEIMSSAFNTSFLATLYRLLGIPGIVAGALIIFIIVFFGMPRSFINTNISIQEWNLFSYLSVILLPIAWVYSILPLIIVLFSIIKKKGEFSSYFAFATLSFIIFSPPWGIFFPDFSSFLFYLSGHIHSPGK